MSVEVERSGASFVASPRYFSGQSMIFCPIYPTYVMHLSRVKLVSFHLSIHPAKCVLASSPAQAHVQIMLQSIHQSGQALASTATGVVKWMQKLTMHMHGNHEY